MSDYYIGLSGLAAARRAFDVIGNNIANAATEGYHRQRLELSPAFSQQPGTTAFIGGVNIEGVSRMIDTLLEQEILRQKSTQAAVLQQTAVLGTLEAAFGELAAENGGLNAAIDNFFNALQNLSAHPEGNIWQNQLVSDAETMAGQFRALGEFLYTLESRITLDAERAIDTVNSLIGRIAELNGQIEQIELVGGQTNSMSDQRDRYIAELSELIEIQTLSRKNGGVDVSTGGIAMVTGSVAAFLHAGYNDNRQLAVSVVGASDSTTAVQGGKIGGLLSLHNDLIAGVANDLDSLANAIIQEINHYHVMGTGSFGSFTELTGHSFTTDTLADIGTISDGVLYIRVTNTATGQLTRHAVAIDAANDTFSDVAAAISAIPGLTASVNASNEFTIAAGANYKFDFMPCVLPEPTLVDFSDASPPTVTVSGIYNGTENDTFEFTVKGDGAVGNGVLTLEVRAGSGALIASLNIGSGYAAGDLLDIGNGIKIALSPGNLVESNGDHFSIEAFADTDPSGFLSAAGLNTFFAGSSAMDIAVRSEISANPQRAATAIGAEGTDNTNIAHMAAIKDKPIGSLGTLTCGEFYQRLVSDIGQELSVKQMQQESIEVVIQNLLNRQNDISGVDINEESAQLLVFEQMFQAMAQYLNTINTSLSSLMEIL